MPLFGTSECYLFDLKAQESISASGGNAVVGGGSVSYSIGQVFYASIGTRNASISQGAQQPYLGTEEGK